MHVMHIVLLLTHPVSIDSLNIYALDVERFISFNQMSLLLRQGRERNELDVPLRLFQLSHLQVCLLCASGTDQLYSAS